MFQQELEAAQGEATGETHAVVVAVHTVANLAVLGKIGQNAAVGDAGFDKGIERSLLESAPHGCLQPVEPFAASGADRDRARVVGLEHVEIRSIGHLVGLVEHEQGGMVFEPELLEHRLDGPDLRLGLKT